jgi:hypothetical protein
VARSFLLFFCLMAIGAGNTMLIAAVLPPLSREVEPAGLDGRGRVSPSRPSSGRPFPRSGGRQSNRIGPAAHRGALAWPGIRSPMLLLYLSSALLSHERVRSPARC